MKLSQAGQVLKGPFFACKRSEGASFFVSRHIHHSNAHRSGLPIRPQHLQVVNFSEGFDSWMEQSGDSLLVATLEPFFCRE